jgi:hypothetical protein
MDPKLFLELTEAGLLKTIGEELKKFFAETSVEYLVEHSPATGDGTKDAENTFYVRREVPNPRNAIHPLAQINMVANITFHLMAQQLAVLFNERPGIDRQQVFTTSGDNIKRLTIHYLKLMKETSDESTSKGLTEGAGAPL